MKQTFFIGAIVLFFSTFTFAQKKPPIEELKRKLTDVQFEVTQKGGTEPPFKNAYWDNKQDGIYVDVVSGEVLFSSKDKFDSGSGWPSFTQPLVPGNVVSKPDRSLGMIRMEVRSKIADSHLGHVFDDGPAPTKVRYCMNSAALRFVPVKDLEREGFGAYVSQFQTLLKATFAGGCFWGVEEIIRKVPGVVNTVVGYTGGFVKNPTYEQVKKGNTGHTEAVEVTFDPAKVKYESLLDYFWRLHDPTTLNRQGNDVGTQYRSVVFFHDEGQKKAALKIKAAQTFSGRWKKPIMTEIMPALPFYPAESYHQDFLQKNLGGYTCHFLRD